MCRGTIVKNMNVWRKLKGIQTFESLVQRLNYFTSMCYNIRKGNIFSLKLKEGALGIKDKLKEAQNQEN